MYFSTKLFGGQFGNQANYQPLMGRRDFYELSRIQGMVVGRAWFTYKCCQMKI